MNPSLLRRWSPGWPALAVGRLGPCGILGSCGRVPRGGRAPLVALAVSALLLLAAADTVAAQIEPGRVYVAGERITDPASGLTVTLPEGWRGALAPDGNAFAMESTAGDAYVLLVGEETTEADVRSDLADAIELGDGVVLSPVSPVREIGPGHLSADFSVRGTPSELVGRVDVRVMDTGVGLAFILLAPPTSAERHVAAVGELVASLAVEEPAAASASMDGGDEWEPYLRGRYLVRYFTGSSYNESTELWLCSDGTFHFDDRSGGFGPGASGAYQGRGGGTWSATGAGRTGSLVLLWSTGTRSTWSLEYDGQGDRLLLEGERWLRGENELCR